MHTPFGSALGFIPDKMLDPQMLAMQSQSYHIAKFDFSMPEPFDSVDTAFPYLLVPAFFVSIIATSTSYYRPTFSPLSF